MTKTDVHKAYIFLALVLLASLPFYALNIANVSLPFGLPLSVAMIVVPLLVAAVFIWRSGGGRSLKVWFSSIIDMKRVKDKKWLLFAIVFTPIVFLAAYGIGSLTGHNVNGPTPSLPVMLLIVGVFWIGAIFEELGWTAFATKPLQKRHGIFVAGLILGIVWTSWHVIPYIQMGRATDWIIFQCIATVGNRIIMGYIFAHSNQTTSPALFYHAALNFMPEFLPGVYASYNPMVHTILVWLVVIFLYVKSAKNKVLS